MVLVAFLIEGTNCGYGGHDEGFDENFIFGTRYDDHISRNSVTMEIAIEVKLPGLQSPWEQLPWQFVSSWQLLLASSHVKVDSWC